MRRFALVLILAFTLLGMSVPVSAQDLDCADLATHDEAQAYFEAGGGSPSYNFNNLDADNDGSACEDLPGNGSGSVAPAPAQPVVPEPTQVPVLAGTSDNTGLMPGSALGFLPTSVPSSPPQGSAMAQSGNVACGNYDAWEWAQSVFESDPQAYGALDPDNDGIACPELPKGGFAPAFWTDKIPENVQEAQIVRAVDGDTFEVLIDNVSNRVRIYRADTPENTTERHCGGQQATDFVTWALSFNDNPGVVYIEKDVTETDRYGRVLGYIWFEAGGQPYMLNHVLINNGWAEDVDYGDRKYDQQLTDAAAFAKRHNLGVWDLCGGFGIPAAAPTAVPQPTQAPAVQAPAANVPAQPAAPAASGCDPNYTPCVPVSSADLDCGDIGFSVQIIGSDPHGFDGNDNDGLGCESY